MRRVYSFSMRRNWFGFNPRVFPRTLVMAFSFLSGANYTIGELTARRSHAAHQAAEPRPEEVASNLKASLCNLCVSLRLCGELSVKNDQPERRRGHRVSQS